MFAPGHDKDEAVSALWEVFYLNCPLALADIDADTEFIAQQDGWQRGDE